MKTTIKNIRKIISEELVIKTKVSNTVNTGSGLYSQQYIPAGSLISKWVTGKDMIFSKEYADSLPDAAREKFKKFASWDGEVWCLSGDDGIYFNHSDMPNVFVVPKHGAKPATWDRIAARDIQPGEELTMDYLTIGESP